jgi:putative ABC transport system permease protein
MMSTLIHDIRYGLRWLLTHRSFTIVAGFVLALGIAANTAVFTLVNAVLLRPLPYPNPDRVVMVWQDFRQRGGPAVEWAGAADVADWLRHTDIFEHLASISSWGPSLTDPKREPEQLVGASVTADYFAVLGARSLYGRGFTADEDRPGGPRAVVLSHALWQRRFGGDPAILGRVLTLAGEPHTVAGIMPQDFRPAVLPRVEIWRAAQLNFQSRAIVLRVLARLRPDVTVAQTNAQLATVAAQIAEKRPERQRVTIVAQPLHDFMTQGLRTPLIVLWASVGLVLLIACTNIANLLLARGSTRLREVAVRMTLGAPRGRIVRQLVTESLLVAIGGGAAGLLLAVWATDALTALAPSTGFRLDQVRLDGTTMAFAVGLSLMTALIFGLAPAVQVSRTDFASALKEGGRGAVVPGGRRARRMLIVAEIALALVLLTGAGLLLRSFMKLHAVDLGFDPNRVLTARVLLPRAQYREPAQVVAFLDQFLARAPALPDVRAVGVASTIPLGGVETDQDFQIEGQPAPPPGEDGPAAWYRQVSAGFFTTLRIQLHSGRFFTDTEAAPAVVINQNLAKRYWPDRDPLGTHVRFGAKNPWFTVVGIVKDLRQGGPGVPPVGEMFLPYRHQPPGGVFIVARTDGDPARLAPALKASVSGLDRNLPMTRVATMEQLLGDAVAQPRFLAVLIGVFAAAALALAAVGIYGIIAFSVAQRSGEIAVRMALGADRRRVLALIVGETLRVTGIGVVIGLVGALLAARVIARLLFGITPTDPVTFGLTALLLAFTAALAAWIPARRATRIDPVVSLRAE